MNESKYLKVTWGGDTTLIDREIWKILVIAEDGDHFEVVGVDYADAELFDDLFDDDESTWDDALAFLKKHHPYPAPDGYRAIRLDAIDFRFPESETYRLLQSLIRSLERMDKTALTLTKQEAEMMFYNGPRWKIWNLSYKDLPRLIKLVQDCGANEEVTV
jgi:hypothetical protein